MQNLSKRLTAIAVLVPKNCRVADIGTDHGYLPIYLVKNGITNSVLACDIGEKPLSLARKNIEASGIQNIATRLSDGFAAINPNEIDAAVIAGIGGEVISGIIERCEWIKNNRYTLILQPTTSPEKLREFLNENLFSVESETAVCENGKTYSIMLVRFSGIKTNLEPYELFIGKLTPETEDAKTYITKQLKRTKTLANDLKNIEEKREDFLYFSKIEKKLTEILGG